MVFCETCGKENNEKARFCKSCGSSLEFTQISPEITSTSTTSTKRVESIGFGDRKTGDDLVIRCSLCGSQDFAKDTGRLDSKWGITSFKVIMLSCRHCGHIELFNKGRSIFDFD